MSLPVCKFYSSNRNCKFGINCRYLHSLTQRPPPLDYITDNYHGEAVNNRANPIPDRLQSNLEVSNQRNENDTSVLVNPTSATDHQPFSFHDNSYTGQDERKRVNHQQSVVPEPRKICQYFVTHGRCAFGRKCRFEHILSDSSSYKQDSRHVKEVPPRFQSSKASTNKSDTTAADIIVQNPLEDISSVQDKNAKCVKDFKDTRHLNNASSQQSSGRICSYFRSGYCRNGRNCRFSHARYRPRQDDSKPQALSPQGLEGDREKKQEKTHLERIPQSKTRAYRPPGIQQIFKLSELESLGVGKLQQLDINFVQKRFNVEGSLNETSNEYIFQVMFTPSDPDWPFDVSSYLLQLILPTNYPKEVMIVKVPAADQDLPDTVRRYLEVSFAEWISERQAIHFREKKVELMARPFFKWLDKNFEDLMTESLKQLKRELTAKAAGFEFIRADDLKAKYDAAAATSADKDTCDSGDEFTNSQSDDDDDESSDECLESDDDDSVSSEGEKENSSLSLDTERKGTEIKLRNLQLKQNASSIMFEKLRMILQCLRCKNNSEVTTSRGKIVALSCDKCNNELLIQYRPTLAHQFSSVIGYLDLENCRAFDLILQDCTVMISCLGCSKITKVDGMVSGQLIDGWCRACNARFKFATESVKFYQLEPSSVDQGNKVNIEVVRPKNKKPPKDPAIREGNPLPDFGTCKHYKQSYRWLRFPCCGKAYPCDICHDKKEDHEMVMANRMICGHCCKEQNYSGSRPCNSCNQHMTKVHSSHWEGGTGCRDKIAMSKSDQQKYKNMHKTVSNHKKKVQSGSQKKSTKLRHT